MFRRHPPSFRSAGGFRWRSQWSREARDLGAGAAPELAPSQVILGRTAAPVPHRLFLITAFTRGAHQTVLGSGATNSPGAKVRGAGCRPSLCPWTASAGLLPVALPGLPPSPSAGSSEPPACLSPRGFVPRVCRSAARLSQLDCFLSDGTVDFATRLFLGGNAASFAQFAFL